MTTDLISDKTLQTLEGSSIRDQINNMVALVKKDFRHLPYELERFNLRLADELANNWKEEKKKLRGSAIKKLEGMKGLTKRFRLIALKKLSNEWYDRLWLLRSDIALICSIYDLSEMKTIPEFNAHWNPRSFPRFDPVVLRMKGPRKPTKKKFIGSDIKYSIKEAFLDMMKPLEIWVEETKNIINKMSGAKKEQTLNIKIKRYREALYAREYITVACQSVSPRQSALNNSDKGDK